MRDKKECPVAIVRRPKDTLEEMNLQNLPEEILIYIASFLDENEKSNLARTCQSLKRISYSKSLWKDSVVSLKLTENIDGFEKLYKSLESRGISILQFEVLDSYQSLAAHLILMSEFWPSLACIQDFSQEEAHTGVVEVAKKVMENVRILSLFQLDTKFITLVLSMFPFLSELDLNMTECNDDCMALLVSSLSHLQILRVSKTAISNQGVAQICGANIKDQEIVFNNTAPKLQMLQVLDCSKCLKVTPQIWKCLSKLERLNTIYISDSSNLADDDDFKSLGTIQALKCLFLRDISDSERAIYQIADSGCRLEGLSLDGNIEDTDTLMFGQGFHDLLYLKLNSEKLTDCGLANIALFLSQLVALDISGCFTISQHGIRYLVKRTYQLQYIRVIDCPAIPDDIVLNIPERICIHSDSLKKRNPDLSVLQNNHQRRIWLRQILCS